MNTMPRQLLTTGTAMAAVIGALLLSAEDDGRTSPTRTPVLDIDALTAPWPVGPRTAVGQRPARADRDSAQALERR